MHSMVPANDASALSWLHCRPSVEGEHCEEAVAAAAICRVGHRASDPDQTQGLPGLHGKENPCWPDLSSDSTAVDLRHEIEELGVALVIQKCEPSIATAGRAVLGEHLCRLRAASPCRSKLDHARLETNL